MTRGVRAAAAGMLVQLQKQDVYTNNLANANTVGYRRSNVAVGSFQDALTSAAGAVGSRPVGEGSVVDVTQGAIHETQSPYDLALNGPGMFTVLTPDVSRYTRDGRFEVDPQGRLMTLGGNQVMGREGPITLPGRELLVTEAGQVFSEGQFIDHLFLAQFEGAESLTRTPDGLFDIAGGPRIAEGTVVAQGCVEQANVTVVREMAGMMTGFRAFEASATALRMNDETLGKLIDAAGS